MIGTLTTRYGLVHEVKHSTVDGLTTICKRFYLRTLLDEPTRVVTCVYCVTGQRWPDV